MKLDRIIVYKAGISILYIMDNPDQKFITTLEEDKVMQAKKIAETFEIKTYINESIDGSPAPFAENYRVETKGNQTYYYTEIIVEGQIRAN